MSQPTEICPLLNRVCACARSLDSPDLPEHIYLHSLISPVVHIANLNFVCLLVGGHHLGSPPSTIRTRGCTDDCYYRKGESCGQAWPRPGHQGLPSQCYPPAYIPSQRPAPQGLQFYFSLSCRKSEWQGVPEPPQSLRLANRSTWMWNIQLSRLPSKNHPDQKHSPTSMYSETY